MNTTTKSKQGCATKLTVCPACGELECLCRPRFFAGQLLSEEDLNRLDRYIQGKNRLHNRYVHGWGVVCGLKVSCEPCSDRNVSVSPGYAISPCGDDIIVCEKDTVDVCALIKKCREKEIEECRPYGFKPECDDCEEQWVLAMRYQESPSRGRTALRDGACGGCGKPKDICGCGSDGHTGKFKRRAAPSQCEPTVICEGYRYEIFRAPDVAEKDEQRGDLDRGELIEDFLCCVNPLLKILKQTFPEGHNRQEQFQVCCRIKRTLKDFVARAPVANCELLERISSIVCPDPSLGDAFEQAMDETRVRIFAVIYELLINCLCNSLLPPCPDPTHEVRVPLAVVTVRCGECRVVRVCNWTKLRRFVLTSQNLQYWLSWLPYEQQLRSSLEKLCCELGDIRERLPGSEPIEGDLPNEPASEINVLPGIDLDQTIKSRDFATLALRANTSRADGFTLQELMRGLAGKRSKDGSSLLTELEQSNPGQFFIHNFLTQPNIAAVLPISSQLEEQGIVQVFLKSLASAVASVSEGDQTSEILELRTQINNLQADAAQQKTELAQLRELIAPT